MGLEKRTEHPHIIYKETSVGPEPHIHGTNIAVRHVVGQYRSYGTVEGVISAYPHLTPAQVHDALSYFYDHTGEIDEFIHKNTAEFWKNEDIPNVYRDKSRGSWQ